MNHKEMWKKIFRDTDRYTDFYFKEKAKKSIVYSEYEKDQLASMAFFTNYPVVYRGKECQCPYIVGVATGVEYRGQGKMKGLLKQGLTDAKHQGAPVAFLSPANPKIYESLGFVGAYYRRQVEVKNNQKKWYTAATFSRMDAVGKERVAEFARAQLYAAELDFYMYRSVEYYEMLHKEMKALGGRVIVLREGPMIRAVASYIREENQYEITEVICDPADGMRVLQSICAFLMEDPDKTLIFSDSYFLGDIVGDGILLRQMPDPYIMIKYLQEEEGRRSLRVYINDIT